VKKVGGNVRSDLGYSSSKALLKHRSWHFPVYEKHAPWLGRTPSTEKRLSCCDGASDPHRYVRFTGPSRRVDHAKALRRQEWRKHMFDGVELPGEERGRIQGMQTARVGRCAGLVVRGT
jgi:hypothetical protein